MIDDKLIIALVGLPARGKSYTSNNLCRFLNWCGLKTKVFNSGEYRRILLGGFQDSDFFNYEIKENYNKKEEISKECFNNLIKWIEEKGDIGIFDATNSNKERRDYLKKNSNNKNILFVELISDNADIINKNLELKLISPDYIDKSKEFAMNDFKQRYNFYNKIYETIEDSENLNYIKIINFTEKLLINNVMGINESLIISYLMNLRLNKYPIYLSRHGKSINNLKNIIGGDCYLTQDGIDYGERLNNYMNNEDLDDFLIITSCLKRTKQTVECFDKKKIESRLLNEIHGGICENMSFEEVELKYPEIVNDRKKDKLRYRYPEGESYIDLFERLKYFVLSLGSYNKPILIVAHNAIIKVLLSYFQEIEHKEIPHMNIKLHQLIKLTPNSKNYNINFIDI